MHIGIGRTMERVMNIFYGVEGVQKRKKEK